MLGIHPSDSGAAEWSRTTDLLITNQLLYQLSYSGIRRGILSQVLIESKTLCALVHCNSQAVIGADSVIMLKVMG